MHKNHADAAENLLRKAIKLFGENPEIINTHNANTSIAGNSAIHNVLMMSLIHSILSLKESIDRNNKT